MISHRVYGAIPLQFLDLVNNPGVIFAFGPVGVKSPSRLAFVMTDNVGMRVDGEATDAMRIVAE
jgi:hypothetical protein